MSANSRSTSANGVDKSILFMKDGSPMVFHLPPGVTKKKLASVVNVSFSFAIACRTYLISSAGSDKLHLG